MILWDVVCGGTFFARSGSALRRFIGRVFWLAVCSDAAVAQDARTQETSMEGRLQAEGLRCW